MRISCKQVEKTNTPLPPKKGDIKKEREIKKESGRKK